MRLGLAALVAVAALAGACSGGDGDSCGSGCEEAALEAGQTLVGLLAAFDDVVDSAGNVSATQTLDVTDSSACTTTSGSIHYGGTVVITSQAGLASVTADVVLDFTDCTLASGSGHEFDGGPFALENASRDGGNWEMDVTAPETFVFDGNACRVDLHGEQSDDFVYTRGVWCGTHVEPLDLGDG